MNHRHKHHKDKSEAVLAAGERLEALPWAKEIVGARQTLAWLKEKHADKKEITEAERELKEYEKQAGKHLPEIEEAIKELEKASKSWVAEMNRKREKNEAERVRRYGL